MQNAKEEMHLRTRQIMMERVIFMWEKIKKRILNIFTVEVEEEDTNDDTYQEEDILFRREENRRKNEFPEAKMTYQYPEERSFRFPIIPDAVEQEKTKRDYLQKEEEIRKENEESSEMIVFPPPTTKSPEVNKEKDSSKRVYKTSNHRFKLSQVPSPIYGFQTREERESPLEEDSLEKPAYLRRQEQEAVEPAIDLDETEQEESTILPIEKKDSVGEQSEQPSLDVSEEVIVTEELPDKEIEADDLKVDEVEEEIDMKEKEEKPQQTHLPLDDMIEQFTQLEKEGKQIPYNVVMNAQDFGIVESEEPIVQKPKPAPKKKKPRQSLVATDHSEETEKAEVVPLHLLDDSEMVGDEDAEWLLEQQVLLEDTLRHFNVAAEVVNVTQGPSVTRFEVQPSLGVKVSKVRNLSDDLKLNMSAKDIRIEAPIPGKNTIGIEIPNQTARMVGLQEIFSTELFQSSTSALTIGLGLNIEGQPIVTDIDSMPHGLIAGATGSGKSVCINTILVSLIYKSSHEDVRLLLIDPKMVELAPYNGIPHLVAPVITNVKAATSALKWAVAEMEERYEKFVAAGVRDLSRYNEKMIREGKKKEKLPFLVIVIDELADLMMMAPQDVEDAICRIAQKARACGIHLLIATQRPSVDVITGLIKANIPTRIAFSVSSQVDSRTIIDTGGAERLLGKGDMLFVENGAGKSVRIQGAFVSDDEVERVAAYARSQAEPNYLFEQEELLEQIQVDEDTDELLHEVIDFIIDENQISTSFLQRQFRIGYNRAARLMDTLEKKGMINQQNGSKPRDVLLTRTEFEQLMK